VNIDDCWQNRSRDTEGRLQADNDRFPHGIKWLASYMHARGLKLGIYTDYGTSTCEGYPGTPLEHQEVDANTFASWDIDSVKVDGCNSNTSTMNYAYPRFGDYLNATGRPMLYSCSWPDYLNDHVNWTAVADKCNLWRMCVVPPCPPVAHVRGPTLPSCGAHAWPDLALLPAQHDTGTRG